MRIPAISNRRKEITEKMLREVNGQMGGDRQLCIGTVHERAYGTT